MGARPAQSFALDKDYHWRSKNAAIFMGKKVPKIAKNEYKSSTRVELRGARRKAPRSFGAEVSAHFALR